MPAADVFSISIFPEVTELIMSKAEVSFAGLRVAALESRRATEMTRLIERFGGQPFVSPSMREVPIEPNRPAIDFAYRVITGEVAVVILTTGVGFNHLLSAIERHVERQRFIDALSDITTVVRGPKPAAALRKEGITPSVQVPEPNTWRELLQTIDQKVPVASLVVGLQEYGLTNASLIAGLEARGAEVLPLRVYGWDFPEDCGPLEANIRAIVAGEREVILFTSAHQVVNLLRRAEEMRLVEQLRDALAKMVTASIGPTTTQMLQECELLVALEPEHPKMGHLVTAAAAGSHELLSRIGQPVQGIVRATSQTIDSNAAWHDSLFLRACRGEFTERTPIWLMRQAGRYMAEYREVRSKISFLDLCKNPRLCSEVMVTAVNRLDVDAAIIFSDLLPILEPLGFDLEFARGDGPVIHNPIREASDVDRVPDLTNLDALSFVFETVRQTRKDLPAHIPLIGFAGAPFTLASYAIDGGGSKNYVHTKRLMYSEPGAWRTLMHRLAATVTDYLNAQIAAGAQCVQLFDSWVGCLDPEDYRHNVLPYMQQILSGIVPGIPVINFATGNPELLPLLRGDRRTVVGVDWRIPLEEAWQRIGIQRSVQGNLDPGVLLGPRELIRQRADEILRSTGGRPGHIFNLGHGIFPQTPVENVIELVQAVKELSKRD